MKTVAILSSLFAASQAFAPVSTGRVSTQLAETSAIDIEQVRSNVFEIHGYFPDFRPFEELPADIQAARSLSGNDMKEANAKYAAITDESDRAFQVLVALGLMEDYSGLSEYDPNETD